MGEILRNRMARSASVSILPSADIGRVTLCSTNSAPRCKALQISTKHASPSCSSTQDSEWKWLFWQRAGKCMSNQTPPIHCWLLRFL
jgi:hypothetical protein